MNDKVNESKQNNAFLPFAQKMKNEGIPPLIIDTFRFYYEKLRGGEKGFISREDILPIEKDALTDIEMASGFSKQGHRAMKSTAIIKLNGGLGTSMGLSKAKSLIEVKNALNFLDIIAQQVLSYREKTKANIPFVLMNSFHTDSESIQFLKKYPHLSSDIPLSFLQHKFPKILKQDLSPGVWPRDPDCEWNPPGHGDIYCALITSGMLDKLINKGYKYAFISNSDNLGGTLDEGILGYFTAHNFPFMIEVAEKTDVDIKGGHLSRLKTGGLILREIAQCPDEEKEEFQNINVYRYFNTNNIWINLSSLKKQLKKTNNNLGLPMIVNPKRIDPRDDSSPEVFQIETAMGSAISVFKNATAIRVPRTRFFPIKRCQDLLALWSDCYVLMKEARIIQNPKRRVKPIKIILDDRYYKKIDQLRERFAYGTPSLIDCVSLEIKGNVYFERGVVIKGAVHIISPSSRKVIVPQDTVIDKDLIFD